MRKRLIIHQYKKHESLFDDICFYCGDFGNTKDHIPAVSCDIDINDVERIIVRSCVLCNSLLGNRYLNELLHRCDYLLIKYQKRFKKHLCAFEWN
jgi:hypothetical protein